METEKYQLLFTVKKRCDPNCRDKQHFQDACRMGSLYALAGVGISFKNCTEFLTF